MCPRSAIRLTGNDLVPCADYCEFWPTYLQRSGCPQGRALEDRRPRVRKIPRELMLCKLYRAGVLILAGTDSPEPRSYARIFVASGIGNVGRGRLAGRRGSAVCDVAECDGTPARETAWLDNAGQTGRTSYCWPPTPLDDIRHTRSIELVIRGGLVCRPAELLKLLPKD